LIDAQALQQRTALIWRREQANERQTECRFEHEQLTEQNAVLSRENVRLRDVAASATCVVPTTRNDRCFPVCFNADDEECTGCENIAKWIP